MSDAAPTPISGQVIDLRSRMRAAGDQGPRGTCVAFAVTGAHESHRGAGAAQTAPDGLSEETLYWGCKQVDGIPGPGTRLSASDAALQRWGQPLEHLWPYDGHRNDQDTTYQPPPTAIDAANCHRASLRRVLRDTPTIQTELASGHAVIVALRVWEGLRRPGPEPIPAPSPSELLPAGHAVAIVGYDSRQGAVLLRNSWGRRWGTDGHLWVSDGLIPLLTGAWVADDAPSSATVAPQDDPVLTEGS
jgi:C1A family cysteine protease